MQRVFRSALPWGLLLALTACAPMKAGRTEPAAVHVEKVPTSIASVSQAAVHLENGQLLVTGRLFRMHEVKMPGHVDVIVCSPDGFLAGRGVAVPGLSSKRKGGMSLPFVARFDLVPPSGSTVTLSYHPRPTAAEENLTAGCPEKQNVP